MISLWMVNLLIPGEPKELSLKTPLGDWSFCRYARYAESRKAIREGKCANTYALEYPDASKMAAIEEVTPITLGASFLTALSATVLSSTMGSEVSFLQPSKHWPRDRSMGEGSQSTNGADEFKSILEAIVANWPTKGQSEKALLLIHHWLDALACWSLEDLYLSATTLLQIISATESDRQGKNLSFLSGVSGAANRMRIRVLGNDFKDMRNELIHEGRLIGTSFLGPDQIACARVVADVMNWLDEYIYAALGLGTPKRVRFSEHDFVTLNAYSI